MPAQGSEPLNNARWEAFAQNLAKGESQSAAYQNAGYKARGNTAEVKASRLVRNGQVAQRVRYLKEQAADEAIVTRRDVLNGLHEEATYFGDGSSHSARVAAWGHLGKHLGMFSEKHEHTGGVEVRVVRE